MASGTRLQDGWLRPGLHLRRLVMANLKKTVILEFGQGVGDFEGIKHYGVDCAERDHLMTIAVNAMAQLTLAERDTVLRHVGSILVAKGAHIRRDSLAMAYSAEVSASRSRQSLSGRVTPSNSRA